MININRILITGVSGFLGRAIAHHFSHRGVLVYGVDRSSVENRPVVDLKTYSALALPDPRFESLLAEWQPHAIIHCAGSASVPQSMQNPAEDYQQGPALSFFVLDTIRRVLPECAFLLLSSAAVYGNPVRLPVREDDALAPISAYGFHKWQSELICQEFTKLYGLKTASARVFSAYGSGLRRQVMWDITQKALTQNEIILQGDGSESRDFLHSADIARALECILKSAPLHGEIYNVASGEETRIDVLAAMIVERLACSAVVKFSGLRLPGVPKNWRADIHRLTTLDFQPHISLQKGVTAFVEWCQNEPKS